MSELRITLLPLFVAALLFAQSEHLQAQPVLSGNGVVNAASFRQMGFPGGQVAPGGLISIFGQGFGPQAGIHAPGFPLPEELGPLQTQARINNQLRCRLLYVSNTQINCQLPEGLAGDRIRLRIQTNLGQSDEIEVPLGPSGFGFFTQARDGRGPLIAQNFVDAPDPQNRFRFNAGDNPARPGQIMVFWGTGLGPVDPPVMAGEPSQGLRLAVHQPEVWVGEMQAQVQYAGRAPGFAGLDQLQIVLPDGVPAGCAVPIRLRQQDRFSNIGTIATVREQDRTRCVDSFEPVLSGLSHGSIVLGHGFGRLGPGQLGPAAGYGGSYPPKPHPFFRPGPGFGGGVRMGPGGVGSNGIGAYGIHEGMHPFAGGEGIPAGALVNNLGPDVVTARFVRLAEGATYDIGLPPIATNSCTSYGLGPYGAADRFDGLFERLDAGNLLISGPGVTLTLEPIPTAKGPLYAARLPSPLQQGTYSATGLGGPDVGPFGPATVETPELVSVTTSLAPGTEISRSTGLTLDWTGDRTDDIVLIRGRVFQIPAGVTRPVANPMAYSSQVFLCTASAEVGQFVVPAYILEILPTGLLTLSVAHLPSVDDIAHFEASGLDEGGVLRRIDTTTYLDLSLVP
jgi:uncharacterized protein (TIGR03437 family)